ncbi:hypothetical protein ACOSQ2_006907 [Xanthoceras sorbifolium]
MKEQMNYHIHDHKAKKDLDSCCQWLSSSKNGTNISYGSQNIFTAKGINKKQSFEDYIHFRKRKKENVDATVLISKGKFEIYLWKSISSRCPFSRGLTVSVCVKDVKLEV